METPQHPGAQPNSPAVLGDILYAAQPGSKPPVAESDWVALARRMADRDPLALQALYERTHPIVYTLIVRIAGNGEAAEAVMLDVYDDLWRRASAYDAASGTVLGWIMSQARSRALARLRYERGSEPPDVDAVRAHTVPLDERNRALRAAMSLLSADERLAIEAAFFSELSHAEIATRLNHPLGTVKTRIRSGLHKLREALAKGASAP